MVEITRTILIVDDDYDIRDAIAVALSLEHYVVQVAPSREMALEIIEQTPPSLILLDWFMPGTSIETFIEKVRVLNPTVEIVLISAAIGVKAKADELGLKYFIAKPFDLPYLLQVVRMCMDAQKN